MLHKRLKKRLSSCLAAVLAVTCMFSSIPVQASNTRAADNRVNLALGITYETNATDADYNESYPDFDHVKMTDGQMASSVWSGASVGFKNLKRGDPAADIPLTLTFDLGGEKDVNAVLFSGWDSNNDGGIRNPVHYVIKYWADGAWQVLHEQSHGRVDPNGGHAYFEFGYTIPDNGSVKASKIMLEITNDPETLVAFLDEVQILAPAEQGGGIAPGTPGNLAKGKSYEVTGTNDWISEDKNYGDPTGRKLTDGVIHTDDSSFQTGDALVGYKVNDAEHQDFIIDLGEEKEVSGYAIHGWCINDYAWLIWNLRHYSVSYLDGNGDWQTLVDTEDRLPRQDDTASCYTWKGDFQAPVTTSKIKFSIRCWSTGLFLSELEVFGTQGGGEPDEPDTYDNKALNRPYTKSEPYSENGSILYPDTGDSELTDGKTGGDSYGDAGWVGFAGQDNEKFVQVDLGKPYDIDKVEFSYCVDSGAGINPPSSTKVTYSLDGVTFYDFVTFQNLSPASGAHTVSLKGEPVVARYVRYNFTKSGSWLFVSEVAAYGTAANLDPKVPYLAQNLPAEKQLYFGNDAELTVSAIIGTPGTVTYEWKKDGTPLEETGATLSLKNVQAEDSGVYQVTVVNELNGEKHTAESNPCTVSVTEVQDAKTLLDVFRTKTPVIEGGKVVIEDSQSSLYKVVIGGSDRETIIDLDGNVYEPLFDTTVNLVYKAVSTTDETDFANADYNVQVVVPGKYKKVTGDNKAPSTLPSIREWKGNTGKFEMTDSTAIVANTAVEKAVAQKMATFFKDVLKKDVSVKEGTPAKGDVQLKIDSSIPEMGAEGYYMDVTDTVVVRAPQQTGLLYGAITVVQSLYSDKEKTFIPKGIARDYPAYKVRGAFLDVARMGYPLEYLEEITKYMAWFKMNDFHLHLNDKADQDYKSFRLESDLQNLTSTDLYYGKEEYKDFQDMAADWGVNIISEIETPGHARAFRDVPGIKMTTDGEHLDLSDRQTVETIKGLFDEMLDGDDPVIRNPVVHIGTDEYYAGTPEQLNEYVYELTQHLAAKGVTMRFWGAFLNNAGVPAGVSKTIPGSQCNIWASSGEWSDTLSPTQMMEYGYDLINSNGYNLYMVPGGVEYSDSLNHANLYNKWDVNHFDLAGKQTNIMPLGHPQVLGADFLIWNDRGTSNTGFSIFDTFTRFQNGTTIVAEKTWHGPKDEDQDYNDFAKRDKMFKDIVGGANPTRKVNSETQTLVDIDFEDASGNTAYDLSDNHLDATVTNGSFVEDNGSTVLSFDGNGSMSLPVQSIGFPYEASFDLKVTKAPAANTKLFSSQDGTFYLNIDGTGKMGFKRDGFKVITPNKDVRFDLEGYTFTFDYKLPLNTWTKIKIKSDKQFTYLEVDGKSYKAQNSVRRLDYPKPSSLDESSISMFSTEKMFEGMTCMVDNLVVKNPELKDNSERNPNLAFECDVTTSPLEDGSMYGRNFYPGALTDGIKNDINTRVSFEPKSETTWAIIDLGKVKDINLIKVFFFESCPEYRISISENGEDWTEVLHKTDGVHGRPENVDVEIDIPFETQKARYVKYEGLQKWQSQWGGYHGGLSEMEVYNMKADFDVVVKETANGTVSVDKIYANEGDKVTVTITPDEGYKLESLTVNGKAVTVEGNTYILTMPAKNVTIAANFVSATKPTFSVTMDSMQNGTVTADKTTANEGDKITLTVRPANGYQLKEIKANGETITPVEGVYSFVMPAKDVTVTAVFEKIPEVKYNINIAETTNGTVSSDKQTAAKGETVTLTVTPANGYLVKSVKVNGSTVEAVGGVYSFVMPAKDVNVEAVFEKIPENQYKVTVLPSENGTVTADKQAAAEGETVTLTVKPASGYSISSVKVNGEAITPVNDVYRFVMPGKDVEVTASFEQGETYKIIVEQLNGGVIVPEKTTAKAGETIHLTVVPDFQYAVSFVWCNKQELVSKDGKYSFVMPAQDVRIYAYFIYMGGSIGGGSSGGGSSKPSKPVKPTEPTWEEVDGVWKLKGTDGEYLTGWQKVDSKWYYLGTDGVRATGWQKVDNKWYYLKSDGVMATGWLKLGNIWYYLNAGGVMQTGWLYNGGVWYYLYSWGGMANTSWVQIGNTWYYFRGNGAMFTGWLQQGTTWYYLKDSGAMATGWNWVGNKCYYFNASGKMAQNTTVGGYKLDASGAWVK
ncbi:InlB B-repeat-containing protein [Fumia xinanensis]|uniref:Discoidin domain-containing protein n=1 Tax=Fumia xinanensis TaxID=2763659 RepID=A0A926E5U7_9FIRM|nr:discoidin domain-containing protein [Fumia xinanensis]MBC8560258.1 discoidin domain-containing protein [Fumia xinanensis]